MRNFIFRAALLFCSVCVLDSPIHGQGSEVDVQRWANETQQVFVDVRRKVRPTLSESERRILDAIEFSVEPTIEFEGVATNQGRRIIKISAGIAFLMNALGQSQVVAYRGNIPCMHTHTMRTIRDAIEGTDSGSSQQRGRNWPIPAFAQIDRSCRGADRLIVGEGERIHASARTGLSLLMLHEIAHHILRHVDQKPSERGDLMRQSRANEDAADRWALRKALEIGEPLTLGMPYLLIITATTLNDLTLEGERTSPHPSGARRALLILRGIEDEFDKLGITTELKNSAIETRRSLEKILPH